jgi:hypothetical protein
MLLLHFFMFRKDIAHILCARHSFIIDAFSASLKDEVKFQAE